MDVWGKKGHKKYLADPKDLNICVYAMLVIEKFT